MMNHKLGPLMHNLISCYQSGFIRGRSITNNIILTQKMIHNINQVSNNENVVMKLDIKKHITEWIGIIYA